MTHPNSGLHNLPSLATVHAACVLHMHADDARQLELSEGGSVQLSSGVAVGVEAA